jgi:choline dehydrogenase-like flavoprotein
MPGPGTAIVLAVAALPAVARRRAARPPEGRPAARRPGARWAGPDHARASAIAAARSGSARTAAKRVNDRLVAAMQATFVRQGVERLGAGRVNGTHRMGVDLKTSVVDAQLRARDHPNLFLVGGGVSPTAGTANPTPTIAALAPRAAAAIRREPGR